MRLKVPGFENKKIIFNLYYPERIVKHHMLEKVAYNLSLENSWSSNILKYKPFEWNTDSYLKECLNGKKSVVEKERVQVLTNARYPDIQLKTISMPIDRINLNETRDFLYFPFSPLEESSLMDVIREGQLDDQLKKGKYFKIVSYNWPEFDRKNDLANLSKYLKHPDWINIKKRSNGNGFGGSVTHELNRLVLQIIDNFKKNEVIKIPICLQRIIDDTHYLFINEFQDNVQYSLDDILEDKKNHLPERLDKKLDMFIQLYRGYKEIEESILADPMDHSKMIPVVFIKKYIHYFKNIKKILNKYASENEAKELASLVIFNLELLLGRFVEFDKA